MKRTFFLLILAAWLTTGALAQVPVVNAVDPSEAKAGAVILANGVNLDKAKLVYLTDGVNDLKMVMVEQKSDSIKFRIPADAKAGVYNVMLETKNQPSLLLVQPVKCTVLYTEVE